MQRYMQMPRAPTTAASLLQHTPAYAVRHCSESSILTSPSSCSTVIASPSLRRRSRLPRHLAPLPLAATLPTAKLPTANWVPSVHPSPQGPETRLIGPPGCDDGLVSLIWFSQPPLIFDTSLPLNWPSWSDWLTDSYLIHPFTAELSASACNYRASSLQRIST